VTLAPPGFEVSPAAPGSRRGGGAGRTGRVGYLAVPALLFFVVFGVVPLIGVLWLSFTRWDGLGAIHPTGLANWHSVLSDPGLVHALLVTFEIMAISWAVQTPASVLIGAFLAGHQRYREWLAVFYFLPLLFSSAAIAITYKGLLDPTFGLGAGPSWRWARWSSSCPGSSSRSTRCSTRARSGRSRCRSTRRPSWTARAGCARSSASRCRSCATRS
jgi:hypothetical protein